MSLSPTDQRELIEPLFSGLLQRPPWQQFLTRLLARTGAERAGVIVRGPGGAGLDSWVQALSVPEPVRRAREALGGRPIAPGLRPLRVYSFAEVLELQGAEEQARHKTAFSAADIAHGRMMRVPAGTGWDLWLILEHSHRDFAAAEAALLSSLGPYLASALTLLLELDRQRRRAEIAEEALAAIGVGQALLDYDRRTISGTLPIPGAALARARAPTKGEPTVIPAAVAGDCDLLLRSAPSTEALLALPGATVALIRGASAAPPDASVLAMLYGLSASEAALALAISEGAELVPAGAALGLTVETTRNYSKRIFAKTGTRGQADLVRLVLTGIAPFGAAGRSPTARGPGRRPGRGLPA